MLVDSVLAHYKRAVWYPATIAQVTDAGYVVTWRDGDLSDTIKGHEQMRVSMQEPTIRPSPDQRRNVRFDTHLLVAMVHSTRGVGHKKIKKQVQYWAQNVPVTMIMVTGE